MWTVSHPHAFSCLLLSPIGSVFWDCCFVVQVQINMIFVMQVYSSLRVLQRVCVCVERESAVRLFCWRLASLLCPVVLSQLRALLPHLFLTNHQAWALFKSSAHSPSRFFTPLYFVFSTPPLLSCSDNAFDLFTTDALSFALSTSLRIASPSSSHYSCLFSSLSC